MKGFGGIFKNFAKLNGTEFLNQLGRVLQSNKYINFKINLPLALAPRRYMIFSWVLRLPQSQIQGSPCVCCNPPRFGYSQTRSVRVVLQVLMWEAVRRQAQTDRNRYYRRGRLFHDLEAGRKVAQYNGLETRIGRDQLKFRWNWSQCTRMIVETAEVLYGWQNTI